MSEHFSDRLAASIDRRGSPVCVGLDPVLDKLPRSLAERGPVQGFADFGARVLEAVAPYVPAVKFQSACYEAYGPESVAVMRAGIRLALDLGLVVILDAKRGDIGITARRYAQAAFAHTSPADAVTLNAYLGPDTVEEFLSAPESTGRGAFVLVRTSNPGSDLVQSQMLADGRTVAEMMAESVAHLGALRRGDGGLSDVGAVVAATKPEDGPALRKRMPDQYFLVPGYGAQGGTAADIRGMLRPGRKAAPSTSGVLVTASRSVIYAFKPDDESWVDAVGAAAAGLVSEIRAVIS